MTICLTWFLAINDCYHIKETINDLNLWGAVRRKHLVRSTKEESGHSCTGCGLFSISIRKIQWLQVSNFFIVIFSLIYCFLTCKNTKNLHNNCPILKILFQFERLSLENEKFKLFKIHLFPYIIAKKYTVNKSLFLHLLLIPT